MKEEIFKKVEIRFYASIFFFVLFSLIFLFFTIKSFVYINTPCGGSQGDYIVSSIESAKVMAENWYVENANYRGLCQSREFNKLLSKLSEIQKTQAECFASEGHYCVKAHIPSGGDWCVDDSGYSGSTANCLVENISCQ